MGSRILAGTRRPRLLALALVSWPLLAVSAQIEEITVSARRIDESLQMVPVSISALSEATLANASVKSLSDLTNLVPNFTFESGENGRRGAPTLRGIGLIDVRGFDNAVGVFIDGVYIAGRSSQNVRLLDLERVEVVRGPQSALYGRNTFAGAINYVSRRPSDEFRSSVEATAAEDGRYELFGAVSGPLAEGLSGRLVGAWADDAGMFDNAGPYSNKKNSIGGGDSTGISGSLRYQPSDMADILFTAVHSEERLDNRPLFILPNNCGELEPAKTFANPTAFPTYEADQPAYRCSKLTEATPRTLSLSPDAYSFDGETTRLALDVKFYLGDRTLQSISAWTTNKNSSKLDLDHTQVGEPFFGYIDSADFAPPTVVFNPGTAPNAGITKLNSYFGSQSNDQDYLSQELRLTSSQEQRLRWSTGLFYFDQQNTEPTLLAVDVGPAVDALNLPPEQITLLFVSELDAGNWIGVKNPILPGVAFKDGTGLETVVLGKSTATQYSVFGSLEYDFTDRLTGTTELRYTYEKRTLNNIFDDFFNTPTGYFEDNWSFWDPRFTLRFQATDDLMVYGSLAHGTRSGGQNVAIAQADLVPYDEETNWTYELGFKSGWFDRRLQLNAAVFYIDWQDAQFRQRLPAEGGQFLSLTTNATGITSSGFELELVAAPYEGVTVGATYGYADSKFDSGTVASGDSRLCDTFTDTALTDIPLIPVTCVTSGNDIAPDVGGNQLPRTAKSTASLYGQIIRPAFGATDWMARMDMAYRAEAPQDYENLQYVPARTLAALRLGLQNSRYDVTLWAENLFDVDVIDSAQIFGSNLNSFRLVTTGIGINPRRIGVTARYRFGAGAQ